jgi:hypothetical protein
MRPVLHRALDVGSWDAVGEVPSPVPPREAISGQSPGGDLNTLSGSGGDINETYQILASTQLWTIKRFHGGRNLELPTDTNPEEVEKEHHEP